MMWPLAPYYQQEWGKTTPIISGDMNALHLAAFFENFKMMWPLAPYCQQECEG